MKTTLATRSHPSFAQAAMATMPMRGLVTAICGVLGLGMASSASAASQIIKDGKTATTVAMTGSSGAQVFDVNTTTVSTDHKTAFNSFSNFDVVQGDTVNLHLPGASTNLVNLVWNASTINGTVNGYLNGKTTSGGAVYFADPYGIVVGSSGTLNVGALSMSAPTMTFMNSLLGSSGNVDPSSAGFATLMQGQEPLAESAGTCLICVAGTVNANNAVRIRATAIDVSGTVFVNGTGTDTLATAVNVGGSAPATLVTDGNTIRLDAEDDSSAGIGDAVATSAITVDAGASLQTAAVTQPKASTASAASWGDIAITAGATSKSAYTDPTKTEALKSAGDLLLDQNDFVKNGINAAITDANLAASDKLGQLAYVRSFSTANVAIGGAIHASGNVLLQSSTQTTATTDATSTGADGSLPVMITGMYGAVFSKASTSIASGASVTSGGQLSVQSSTDNTLSVAANTVADGSGNFAATTVAWSQAAVDAESSINGTVSAGSLDMGAHNSNSFNTTASAMASSSTGSVGLAGAISLQTVKANTALDSNPTLTSGSGNNGNITVAAESDTTKNSTSASTGTSSADESKAVQGDSAGDMSATMAGKTSTDSKGGSSFAGNLPFKLGAAVAWTDSDNAATATVGNGVTINTAGNLAVQAIVSDAGIHNAATSDTASQASSSAEGGASGSTGGSGSGSGSTSVNVAAAVSYGNYQHEADAEIGTAANITASNIGIGSQVIVPFDWAFGLPGLASDEITTLRNMGNSLSDFIAGAKSIPTVVTEVKALPETIADAASGYASASAGDASVDIGGSVNYFGMSNTDRSWVGDGSILKSTASAASAPGNDSWQSTLDWNPAAPTTWDHSISIVSDTEVAAFNLVGDIKPWVASTQGDKAAIGGAFNYGGYENDTTAGVGSGVNISSTNDVGVTATSHDTLVVLSPVSGKGGSASIQGTVALTDVDDHTHATLSASDQVTARALDVTALNPMMVWSLSGALSMSNQASVGISIGINSLTTDTLASIGNNSGDETLIAPDQSVVPAAPNGLAESGGTLAVASLRVLGSSSGESGALSVAGSNVSDPPPSGGSSGGASDGSGDSAAASGSGSGLLSMLKSVGSVADKLRGASDKLSSVLDSVDELTGSDAAAGGTSLLDKASDKLDDISNGDATLQKVIGKVTSLGANKGKTTGTPSGTQEKGSFGIAISGAASVNMARLGTQSVLDGITVDNGNTGGTVAVQAIDKAQLMSGAGGVALTRSKSSSGGGDLAGAVAYSTIADTTASTINDSTLLNASNVAVQALDGSEQVDVGVGVAAKTGGSGTSATLAGSVSIGTSANHTSAKVTGSTLDGGTGTGRSLEVSAYDHSTVGVGAGSLDVNTGSGNSVNGALAFTYAGIANQTSAGISGHAGTASAFDINDYDTLTLRALDASLIGAGAATGSISSKGQGLAGAFIWNQIGNGTTASVDGGARIKTDGAMLIQANAVDAGDASVSSLNALIDAPASASGYDFSGSGLAFSGTSSNGNDGGGEDSSQPTSASLTSSGWGSSIIAVAGDVSVGKNNVGLSFVGSQVTNTHQVSIGNADLQAGGALGLQAQDNTRIMSLAVGVGVSTGQLAAMGSATYNNIANTDAVLLGSDAASGDATSIAAASVNAQAQDISAIYSLAGNVAISKGNAAIGGAVTYNNIANTIETKAGATSFNTGAGDTSLLANDNATIMSGAVAAGGAKGTALMLSFGWNQTANNTSATLENGSVVTAANLNVDAGNNSTIESLSGSVGIGGTAGVGLSASMDDIGDNTTATLQNTGIDLAGGVTVQAIGSGTQYALAVAGSAGGDGAGAGAASYNTISGDTSASASRIYGVSSGAGTTTAPASASSLVVKAQDSAAISSLALGVGIGGDLGIGGAASISTIGGSTSANLDNSVLAITNTTQISAASTSTIKTLSIAGAAAGDVAVSGSDTTNFISNTISASMTDVGTADGATNGAVVDSANNTSITANNNSTIDALAGAVAGAGDAAVGAAIAVNKIGTTTDASFHGGSHNRTYKAEQFVVSAGASNPNGAGAGSAANINAIAVGAAGGGDVGVAGSVAVNLLGGSTDARIDANANVIANSNVGVLASNNQGIDVLAGAAAIGGTAGVGVGVVVNNIDGTTSAGIYNSNVTAYGNDAALAVDSGTLTNATALGNSLDITGSTQPTFLSSPSTYVSPDLSDTQSQVHGLAVNASNQQNIATLGVTASVAGTAALSALAGVNDVGGSTTATIQNAQINQADYVAPSTTNGVANASGNVDANADQQIDVRASSRQYEANLVAVVAVSGTAAGSGAVATNVFDATTTASVIGTTATSQAGSAVSATASQWSLAAALGLAASGEVGGAASAAVTLFKSHTDALVDGGKVQAGSLDVLANDAISGSQLGGAIGFGAGTAGVAGVALVNVDNAETSATVQNHTSINSPGNVAVQATSSNDAQGLAIGGAVGLFAGVAGGAAVNVIADSTHASVDDSTLTAGSVAVKAIDTQLLNVYSGQLGGGFVGVGGGINLSLLQASVGAGVLDSTVNATNGDLAVAASSTRNVTSVAASAGVGAVGVGLSAGVVVAGSGDIGDTSDGNNGNVDTQGNLNASGQVNMGNLGSLSSGNRVDSNVSNYGLSSDQLGSSDINQINSDGSYQLSSATGSGAANFGASDGVQATISGGSATARNAIAISADVSNSTSNTAGGFSAGLVAVGGSLAYTTLNSDIAASVGSGATVHAGNGVSIEASSGDASGGPAASTNAVAGSAGLVAVDAAVSVSHVANSVSATDAGTLVGSGGALSIKASDSSTSSAGNSNVSGITVGAIAAGIVVVDALRDTRVNASIAAGTSTSGFAVANVTASDSGAVTAQGVTGVGGVLGAVSGVVANAGDTSQVTSDIGSGATVNAGSTTVTASAAPVATASAEGITVGGVAGIGANIAETSVNTNVQALVGDNAIFGNGDLGVYADLTPVLHASASGGAGAGLYGANAAVAGASNTSTLLASIGNDVVLPSGNVTIMAASSTDQNSSAEGITVGGILAVGAADSTSTSNITSTASLGDGNGSEAATSGNLTITATGKDTNDASSTAGSGGLIAGNASLATTASTSTTKATVGQNLDLDKLANFSLVAMHTTNYGGQANSINAAAVGASGANVNNNQSSTADPAPVSTTAASIGNGSKIETQGDLHVEAQSQFASDSNNQGATGGAGGIAVGNAAGVATTLTANNTTTIGTGVTLAAGLNPLYATGNLVVLADTRVNGLDDQASLSGYGLVAASDANVNLQGNFNSTINIEDGSTLSSNNRLDIATYAQIQKISAQASASSDGAGAVGISDATNDLASNQAVNIGNNVALTSVGEADIVAGKDILNAADTELNPSAIAQSYVRAIIPIPHASATANTTSNATLILGSGSSVVGGGDVAIGSMSGTNLTQVDGTGHGYILGFIPVTQNGNHQNNTTSATTTLDGSVLAGKYAKIAINIDQNGNLTDGGSSSPYQYVKYNANGSTANGAQGGFFNPTTYYNAISGADSGSTYAGWDNTNVGAIILGGTLAQHNGLIYGNDLLVSGGNAYVYGSSVGGNGSVTANGAPSITINNASPDYLILPGMQIGFGSTGSVIVSGGANPNLPGISVTKAPSNIQPSITVNSSYPVGSGATPGIAWLNPINNLGGSVTISTAAGSMIEAPINANVVTVAAPNGGITFDHPTQDFTSGGSSISSLDNGGWLAGFLGNIVSNPDNAAAAIVNSVYGGGATNGGALNSTLMNYNNNSPTAQRTPVVLYGYCLPYTSGGADGCGVDSGWSGVGIISGRSVDAVPYIALSQSGNFTNNPSSSGSYNSQTLSVTANFININSPIYVGTPATWSVQTNAALTTWMGQQSGSNPIVIPIVDGNGNQLLATQGATQLIGASYNPSNGQIILDNVNASGGGQAYFNGKIVSTGQGSIHVNSGFGQVLVDNTTGHALVVNNIYTGSGGLGLITFTDKLDTLANGTPKTTWYVSQSGGAARAYDNSNGATIWQNGALLGAVDANTTYQPLSGEEYTWSANTAVNREGGASHWSWGSAGNGTAGQHWTLGSANFVGSGGTGYANLGGNDYVVSLSGQFTDGYSSGVWYHGCDGGLGSSCHYSTNATGYDAGQQSWHSEWDFISPTAGNLTLNFAQRADMPIGIAFTTNQSNRVEIDSNADILLNGIISNTNAPLDPSKPDTLLDATNGGSILQNSKNALVWTHDLSMITTGGGSIGTVAAPILARIVHDSSPGSTLSAHTDGAGIDVNVDSGNSDQAINAIASGAYGYGDVAITGTGSLIGISGNARDVVGDNVDLVSTLGSIGTLATPLNIETHSDILYNGSISGGTLDAHARSDIGLTDFGGDIWVGSIVSDVGDVSLTARNGGIYDARLLTSSTTLSPTQAQAVWTRLGLNSTSSASNIAASLQNQVNAAYTQYWQLLSVGTVSNGVYTLNASAVALYWPLAAAANNLNPASAPDVGLTQAYVASRYSSAAQLFTTYVGSNWQSAAEFTTQSSTWNYTIDPTSTFYKNLVTNTQWSTDQLTYAINAAALAAPSGAQVGAVSPNISAHNITLNAAAGGIGQTVAPIEIPYQYFKYLYTNGSASYTNGSTSPALQYYAQALGSANTPGDITLLNLYGQLLQPTDPNLNNDLFWISIAQTNPLYLTATGAVAGKASGSVYVQANGDLNLGGLQSGADMRLAATGGIDAAAGSNTTTAALTTGGDLVINAGSGSVDFGNGTGSANPGDALAVQIAGQLLDGSASGNFMLTQLNGDLDVHSVYGGALVSLAAPHGSILGQYDGLNIAGDSITLNAHGDIGRRVSVSTGVDAPSQVQVGADGVLSATAGGAVNIASPTDALQIGTIESGGDLTVTATKSALDAGSLISQQGIVSASAGTDATFDTVQAATGATLTAAGQLVASNVNSSYGDIDIAAATGMSLQNVNAMAGNVVANLVGSGAPQLLFGSGAVQAGGDITVNSSGTLVMNQGSSMDAGGAVALTSVGDMQLGTVQSMAATGTALTIQSGGAITGNGAAVNLRARQGGATSLQATNDMGSATSPLVVDVTSLTGQSKTGSVWLHALGDISIPDFETPDGNLTIAADNALNANTLTAGGTGTLSSGAAMTLGTVTSAGDLQATAGTDLTAATLSSGGHATLTATSGNLGITGSLSAAKDATLASGRDSTIAAMTVGGALALNSGGNAHIVQGTVGGASQIGAGGELDVDSYQAGSDVTTQSGAATNLGNVVLSNGSIQSSAGTDLNVTQALNVQQGNATLKAGADMDLAKVTTSGDLTAQAGGNLQATMLDAGRNATLIAGQAMTLGTVTSAGDLQATAGTDLTAATLSSGGHATLTATSGNLGITGSLSAAKDATLASGRDSTIAAMTVGGALALNSGGNAHIVQGTVGGASQIGAGGELDVDSYQAGSDVTTQSGAATNLGNVVLSNGSIQSSAGTDLNVTQALNVQQGNATLKAGADMDLAKVTTSGDLTAQAGGNLQATTLEIGNDGRLNAGGNISLLGATSARASLDMLANGHLGFVGITAGTDVTGQSSTDGIDGASVDAVGSIRFTAAKDIHIGTQTAGTDIDLRAGTDVATQVMDAGHDVDVAAGGDVQMYSTHAGNLVTVDAGGTLNAHDVEAGHAIGLAAQLINFTTLSAPDSITLLARDGNVIGSSLTTRDAFVAANGDIALDAAYIGDRINLAANDITAQVTQTSKGQPLYSVLTGYQGGVARRITVDADASQQWMIDRLSAVQAALATTAPRADIASGHIEQTMSLDTPVAKVRMNQQSAQLIKANVQLMQPHYDFLLYQDGIHTLTDAFIVRYDYGFQMQTPNYVSSHLWLGPDYLGESALRNNLRLSTQQDQSDDNVSARRAIPAWIHADSSKIVQSPGTAVAVNLKLPDAPN